MKSSIPRLFKSSKGSFFLFGPRGTGKSTWLKDNCENSLRIDMLDPGTFRSYSAHPEKLAELVSGNPDKKTVIVYEVQKVPELLDVVHRLIEEKKNIQFVLTGSSSENSRKRASIFWPGALLFTDSILSWRPNLATDSI